MPETVMNLANGWSLRSDDGDNVRLCEPDGTERLYWDSTSWHEDPVRVMAEIFRAAASVVSAERLAELRTEMRAEGTEFSTCKACDAEIIRYPDSVWQHWHSGLSGEAEDPRDPFHRIEPADNDDSVKSTESAKRCANCGDDVVYDVENRWWVHGLGMRECEDGTDNVAEPEDKPEPKPAPTLVQGDAVVIEGRTYTLDSIGTQRAELRRADHHGSHTPAAKYEHVRDAPDLDAYVAAVSEEIGYDTEPTSDSVKPAVSDATRAAFLLAADAMNRFALLARSDPAVTPELAAKINTWQQDLSSCDWPIVGYDTSDPPATSDSKPTTATPGVYVKGDNRMVVTPQGQIGNDDGTFATFPTVAEAVEYLTDVGYRPEENTND